MNQLFTQSTFQWRCTSNACVYLLVLLCFCTLPQIVPADIINIPDNNLRTVIEEKLGISSNDPISRIQMESLTSLNGSHVYRIHDLSGLEYAINLEELDLSSNDISDLVPLNALLELRKLNLGSNEIIDIEPIAELHYLEELKLYANQITDLSPTSSLIMLKELSLSDNDISDLSPISGLDSLTYLSIFDNEIINLGPLSGLINLEYLNLDSNQITDLSPLNSLSCLLNLSLVANKLNSLPALPGLICLDKLYLSWNTINDFTGLCVLPNLKELYVEHCGIDDDILLPISCLGGLSVLNLTDNSIGNLNPLSGLSNLQYLFLGANDISDMTPIAGLSNLKILTIQFNEIEILPDLSNLVNLTHLYLHSNKITELDSLSGLSNLLYLDLDRNLITKADGLEDLPSLRELDLGHNHLTDISALANLDPESTPDLDILWLNDNDLTDISALSGLTQLSNPVLTGRVGSFEENQFDYPGLRLEFNCLDTSEDSPARILIEAFDAKDDLEVIYFPQKGSEITFEKYPLLLSGNPGNSSIRGFRVNNNTSGEIEYTMNSADDWVVIETYNGTNNPDGSCSGTIEPGGYGVIYVIVESIPDYIDSLSSAINVSSNSPYTTSFDESITISPPVRIPDYYLFTALRLDLWLYSTQTISALQMETLKSFSGINRRIVDLTGLEHAANLEELDLNGNYIRDLSPISNLSNLDNLDIRMNFLDITSGSDDRAIIDTLSGFGIVEYDPQRDSMQNFDNFLTSNSIPVELSGDLDTNGPLAITNILAFSMGINPMTATPGQLPLATRAPGLDTFSFFFHRDLGALGITTTIETSSDMQNWTLGRPLEYNILSDDGKGHQYVEAVFENPSDCLFFQLNVTRY